MTNGIPRGRGGTPSELPEREINRVCAMSSEEAASRFQAMSLCPIAGTVTGVPFCAAAPGRDNSGVKAIGEDERLLILTLTGSYARVPV